MLQSPGKASPREPLSRALSLQGVESAQEKGCPPLTMAPEPREREDRPKLVALGWRNPIEGARLGRRGTCVFTPHPSYWEPGLLPPG